MSKPVEDKIMDAIVRIILGVVGVAVLALCGMALYIAIKHLLFAAGLIIILAGLYGIGLAIDRKYLE